MTEKLASILVGAFASLETIKYGKEIIIFIISLFPILELRGGLIAASLLDVSVLRAFIICFIGNILPVPFILLFITKIFDYLKTTKMFGKFVLKIEEKALTKKESIERLKYIGLMLFVGIPLPGTGAWTGSLLACLLNMDKKKSFIFITLGVVMAGVIMLIISYGILGNIVG